MARKPLSVILNGVIQFGDLTVLGEQDGAYVPGNGHVRMLRCRCICGSEKLYILNNVKTGKSRGCGCRRNAEASARRMVHGDNVRGKRAPEYRSWSHAIGRCHNPGDKAYASYGGRGITVCDRWRDSYEAFLEDMGRRPSPKHSIDRIDVNGNYEPGNCRWATKKTQDRNKRTNRWVEFRGERLCLADASRKYGIDHRKIGKRLDLGWSVERALTTP